MENHSPKRKYLRPEAGSLRWCRLDEAQRKAFKSIIEMLEEAIDNLQCSDASNKRSNRKGAAPPWFDSSRENRMVLLEGKRGTGKTSVMLSLVHACEDEENQCPKRREDCECASREQGKSQISLEEKPEREKEREEIKEKLKKLRCRTIWLEPLDMDPLPAPTNLLAAVLARIEDAIKIYIQPSTKADGRRDPCGILELCPDYLEALQQLSRLQANVALAWDGNISARGAQLDPDTYAMEVIRAENARLTLRHELSAALNNLAENIPQVCGVINPIFVLPVDDLDLNPTRCLEVLRLLRLIDVPRLFIVILGDIKMIEAVLNLKYTGNFMDVLGVSGSGRLDHSDRKDIKKNASEVSYNVMRKLLPPGQRIRLGSMDVWEALNFRPQGPNSENLPRLHELLARVSIKLDAISKDKDKDEKPKLVDGNAVETLRDFLLYPARRPANDAEITKENLNECCYNAKAVLRMPPRHVADWWYLLQSITRKESDFFDVFGWFCRSAIGEDSSLMPEDRKNYREALRKNPSTREWELFLGITSIPETRPTERISLTVEDDTSQSIKKEFHLCSGNSWRLYPVPSEILAELKLSPIGDTNDLKVELSRFAKQSSFSDHTASALLLFHDLLALGSGWKSTKKNILIYRPNELWARTEWKNNFSSKFISWPVPGFLSSWGYDIFLSYWNVAVAEYANIDDTKKRQVFLVYAWIDAATATLLREAPLICSKDEIIKISEGDKDSDLKKFKGKELANRLNSLFPKIINKEAKEEDARGSLTKEWLLRLPNFLMPEVSGFEKEFVEPFGKEPELASFWKDVRWNEVEQFRNEIFGSFKKNKEDKDEAWVITLKMKGIENANAMGIKVSNAHSEPS